jgi:Family of unknown function (DUF5682)/VWA domain containing CoxE-like protein
MALPGTHEMKAARFIDLPQSIQLAQEQARQKKGEEDTSNGSVSHSALETELEDKAEERDGLPTNEQTGVEPLDLLAKSAGYDDYELWWERQIEQRRDVTNLFEGILEAMTAMRETRGDAAPKNEREAQREAHMRHRIRAAQKAGFSRIAVVCGAWHAPALSKPGGEQADAELLDGLERIQVEATWIPWTNSRLSFRSGYGAGVTSPGWYEHLWTAPDRTTIRWVAQAAHLLRAEGLGDLHEAIQTLLCNGNAEPMQLIRDKLEIGEELGEVPAGAPAVPLQRDLEIRQRKLRFKPSPTSEMFGFDLRKETDRARALAYCQQVIVRPSQTIPILITDLYEGRNAREMLRRAGELKASGAQVICLLALSDRGAPSFDRRNAALLASMDIPAFACTPELFPDLMAAAIQRKYLAQWAAGNDIVTIREEA